MAQALHNKELASGIHQLYLFISALLVLLCFYTLYIFASLYFQPVRVLYLKCAYYK